MWVKAREREKNKEKCVNGATFLTNSLLTHNQTCPYHLDSKRQMDTRRQWSVTHLLLPFSFSVFSHRVFGCYNFISTSFPHGVLREVWFWDTYSNFSHPDILTTSSFRISPTTRTMLETWFLALDLTNLSSTSNMGLEGLIDITAGLSQHPTPPAIPNRIL
jgi:hypothetical protein